MISLKLNIGCGPSGLKGWLNYDWGILPLLSKLTYLRKILIFLGVLPKAYETSWPPIKLVDIRRKFPLKNNTVKYIYCSHVLEHFDRWEAAKILKECHRVMKNGGVIRLVVPDIEKLCRIYLKGMMKKKNDSRPAQDFCRLWWGYDKDIEPRNLIQRLSRKFIRDHQWNYDERELSMVLKEAGFIDIKSLDFREGMLPDLEKLDLENHKDHSLYMEAIKG